MKLANHIENAYVEDGVKCFVNLSVAYIELTNSYNIKIIFSFDDINKIFSTRGENDFGKTASVLKKGLDRKTQRKKKMSDIEMFYDKILSE